MQRDLEASAAEKEAAKVSERIEEAKEAAAEEEKITKAGAQ